MEAQPNVQTFQRLKDQATEPQSAWDDNLHEAEAPPSCQIVGFTGVKGGG